MRQILRKVFQPIHPSWNFYAGVCGIIAGIIYSTFSKIILVDDLIWLVVTGIIFLLVLFVSRPFCLVLAFSAGIIFANYRAGFEIISQNYFNPRAGQTIVITGKISEDPDTSDGKTTLRLQNLHVVTNDNTWLSFAGTVYVQLSGETPELMRSDEVTLEGKLSPGFGTFVATLYRPTLQRVTRASPGDLFATVKSWFTTRVHQFIASPEADLGLGYLMGLKSGLPDSLAEALKIVGMTHVVVASGTHLGILVTAAKRLFGKLSKFAGLLGALLLIAGFVLIVGFTPSMTRAALVSSLSLLASYVGRKFTPLRLLLLVASLTLLINPTNLLNLGWQLSFASFFGILLVAPRLQKTLYGGKKPPWLAAMLITSAATSLVCAPVLIYNFGTISVLALVANLIILPTLPYAMLLVLLTGIANFLPWLAQIFAWLATLLLDLHINVVSFLSEQQMFVFEFEAANPNVYIIYAPLLLFLIFPFCWQRLTRLRRVYRQKLVRKRELCYNDKYEN